MSLPPFGVVENAENKLAGSSSVPPISGKSKYFLKKEFGMVPEEGF
jgi:hypothetical protein